MAPSPVLFAHPSSVEHDTGGHPEQPERIVSVMRELERREWLGYELIRSPAVERIVLERVHPAAYVDAIERACASGGGFLDADTVVSRGSFEAAMHSCGGAVAMVERVLAGGAGAVGFSAHRPPGHHALPTRPMGFCLFNNIAVAARHAVSELRARRVLVLDWDVHHGNGTNDVFHDSDEVLFVSIHQWPLYPGTGPREDVGGDSGVGYTINLPVPPASGDAVWVSLVRDVAIPVARAYEPELVLVSAGFDAHSEDPLADCRVSDAGFAAMAWLVRGLAQELEIPVAAVMEGGYNVDVLARCVAHTMEVLAGGDPGAQALALAGVDGAGGPACGVPDALALEARARLREYWPVLA